MQSRAIFQELKIDIENLQIQSGHDQDIFIENDDDLDIEFTIDNKVILNLTSTPNEQHSFVTNHQRLLNQDNKNFCFFNQNNNVLKDVMSNKKIIFNYNNNTYIVDFNDIKSYDDLKSYIISALQIDTNDEQNLQIQSGRDQDIYIENNDDLDIECEICKNDDIKLNILSNKLEFGLKTT